MKTCLLWVIVFLSLNKITLRKGGTPARLRQLSCIKGSKSNTIDQLKLYHSEKEKIREYFNSAPKDSVVVLESCGFDHCPEDIVPACRRQGEGLKFRSKEELKWLDAALNRKRESQAVGASSKTSLEVIHRVVSMKWIILKLRENRRIRLRRMSGWCGGWGLRPPVTRLTISNYF